MTDADRDGLIDFDLAGENSPAAVTEAWESVMDRGRDVLPLFDGCDLGMTITVAAHALGLRDKSELQHLLVKRRLPPFILFRNWCYVVQLVDRFSSTNEKLGGWALHRGLATSTYYDLVKRSTARTWTDVEGHGPVWARAKALQTWALFL